MNSYSKPLLFADGTRVLITANNLEDLQNRSAPVLKGVSRWFIVIGLSLNIDQTNLIKFHLNHFQHDPFQLFYKDKKSKIKKYKIALCGN
jgi:hypothetical protein